jgi:hypothetical protein
VTEDRVGSDERLWETDEILPVLEVTGKGAAATESWKPAALPGRLLEVVVIGDIPREATEGISGSGEAQRVELGVSVLVGVAPTGRGTRRPFIKA